MFFVFLISVFDMRYCYFQGFRSFGFLRTLISYNIIINLFSYVLECFCFYFFVSCPFMSINVSVQHNGEFLPDKMLLNQIYYVTTIGNPFICHEVVLVCSL